MNVDFVNPFLQAVMKVLKTMAFIEPKPGKPFLKRDTLSKGDITGIVGLTGPVNGSIAVSFSEKAILTIVSTMLGEAFTTIDQEVRDAVGELSNMICGDARRILEQKGYRFQASIPTVVDGKGHIISHTHHGPILVIPFAIQDATCFVEACFED